MGHAFDDSPYQVEVSYFWLTPWDTSAQAIDPTGNLFSPFTSTSASRRTPRVDHNSLVQIHEISRLEGGEVNLKCTTAPAGRRPDGRAPVRRAAHRDSRGVRLLVLADGNANPVSVHAHTNNDLWGPQIGGLVECGHQDVWLRVEGKAAVCNNDADRDLDANVNGTEATHPRFFDSGTAMVGDIGASILWRPTPALTAKIGYQALWCDQLALAARNFAPDLATLTNPAAEPPMNARGTLIYHGPLRRTAIELVI